jgi:hypothetical protein
MRITRDIGREYDRPESKQNLIEEENITAKANIRKKIWELD